MNNERDFLMSCTSESDSDIYHHGIIGQKWGVRRFQNKDGSLTAEGRKHYDNKEYRQDKKALEKLRVQTVQSGYNERRSFRQATKVLNKAKKIQEKRELTDKERKKAEMKLSVATQMMFDYEKNKDQYYKMVNDAKEKYGDKKIKDIDAKTYKQGGKNGPSKEYVSGSVIPVSTYAVAAGMSLVSAALMISGAAPIGIVMIPNEEGTKAANWYKKQKEYEKAWKKNEDKVIRAYLS